MNGSISFLNSNCACSFDGSILEIYCINGEAKDLLFEKIANGVYSSVIKPIPTNRLVGCLFDSKQTIVFFIDPVGYGFTDEGICGDRVVIKVNVLKYIISKWRKNGNNVLVIGSKQFHKFLNLFPRFSLDFKKGDRIGEIFYESASGLDKAEFLFRGKKFVAYPFARTRSSGNVFEFLPEIHVKSDERMTEAEMISLADTLYEIISFLFMRNNILPDYICYHSGEYQFDLKYCKSPEYVEEKEDVNSLIKYGFVRWNVVCGHFQRIIDDFVEGNVKRNHLGEKSSLRKMVSFEDISTISAFFESTYDLIYGDKVIHRSSTQKAINQIVEELKPLKENGNRKIRDIVDYLFSQLEHVTLETKIEQSLEKYKRCLTSIKDYFVLKEHTSQEIATTCAQMRNWTNHGDKRAKLDSFKASCFCLLLCLTYSMYLKRWGVDEPTINKSLRELYMV